MLTDEDRAWIGAAVNGAVDASKDEIIEAMRNIQTEMLRGFESFSLGNSARMVRMETSDALMNTRMNALEERVLYLETRRPPA
jgi:hypothetical protein